MPKMTHKMHTSQRTVLHVLIAVLFNFIKFSSFYPTLFVLCFQIISKNLSPVVVMFSRALAYMQKEYVLLRFRLSLPTTATPPRASFLVDLLTKGILQ